MILPRSAGMLLLGSLLAGCGGGQPGADAAAPSPAAQSKAQRYFSERVQPSLDSCRGCHLPGAAGDTGRGTRFRTGTDHAGDYARYYAAWQAYGGGIEDNAILRRASAAPTGEASGAGSWPLGTVHYNASRILFSCWQQPQQCDALIDAELAADTVTIAGPDCAANDCPKVGGFTPPFKEPRVTQGGARSEADCETAADGSTLNCKPSAVHVALLDDDRILYYNGLEGSEKLGSGANLGFLNDQSRLMSLRGDTARWSWPSPVDGRDYGSDGASGDSSWFCSDLSNLGDGRILVTGGTNYLAAPGEGPGLPSVLDGLRSTGVFDFRTERWTPTGNMAWARWYPTTVMLPDGDVFVASGVAKLIFPIYPDQPQYSGRNVVRTETWNAAAGEWRDNGVIAERSLPLYPRLHLLPNGQIFYNAGGEAYNPMGGAYDQALWNIAAAYDPASRSWTDLGYGGLPLQLNRLGLQTLVSGLNPSDPAAAQTLLRTLGAFVGRLVEEPGDLIRQLAGIEVDAETLIGAGFRGSTSSLMLSLQPDADGEYRRAEFLTAGGVLGAPLLTSPGSYLATRLSRIDTVDIAGTEMRYHSRLTGSLLAPRWFGTALLLPTGEPMMFSGADRDEVLLPESGNPNLVAERFDLVSETWQPMARQQRPRTYHNTALLLPDGRVLVAGHAPLPSGDPNQVLHDPTFEIYSPPYMFLPRPVITAAPAQARPGERLDVQTSAAAEIESVMLVRRTAMTHVLDAEQRSVQLAIAERSDGGLRLRLPTASVLPPGPYMLFVNWRRQNQLVPSEARALRVLPAAP